MSNFFFLTNTMYMLDNQIHGKANRVCYDCADILIIYIIRLENKSMQCQVNFRLFIWKTLLICSKVILQCDTSTQAFLLLLTGVLPFACSISWVWSWWVVGTVPPCYTLMTQTHGPRWTWRWVVMWLPQGRMAAVAWWSSVNVHPNKRRNRQLKMVSKSFCFQQS